MVGRTRAGEIEQEGLDGLRVQQQLLAARLAHLSAPAPLAAARTSHHLLVSSSTA